MYTREQNTDKNRKTITQWIVMVVSIAMAFYHLYFATIGFITRCEEVSQGDWSSEIAQQKGGGRIPPAFSL